MTIPITKREPKVSILAGWAFRLTVAGITRNAELRDVDRTVKELQGLFPDKAIRVEATRVVETGERALAA